MASFSVRATAVVIFVVFCGTTDVIAQLSCFRLEDLQSCIGPTKTHTPNSDPLTRSWSPEEWQSYKAKVSKCVERTRKDTPECKSAELGPAKKVIDSLFTQSPPTNTGSGVTSAVSILTALVSLFLSLALSR